MTDLFQKRLTFREMCEEMYGRKKKHVKEDDGFYYDDEYDIIDDDDADCYCE